MARLRDSEMEGELMMREKVNPQCTILAILKTEAHSMWEVGQAAELQKERRVGAGWGGRERREQRHREGGRERKSQEIQRASERQRNRW